MSTNQVQPRQGTLFGGILPPNLKNPSKDLTPAQRKIYNYLRKLGPLTEKQISIQPVFHDISDVGRALRKMREIKDPVTRRPIYVESYSQRNGPQLWEARP